MDFVANLMDLNVDAAEWGAAREAEGWDVVGVADHLRTGLRAYPHMWVTATALAMGTQKVKITTTFANNLFRSPAEFAQGALALQKLSNGRFEAGLGAGWARDELVDTGREYPPPGERVERYVEACQIVRSIMATGSSHHDGRWYRMNIDDLGPLTDSPPPLVGSLGGPRMMREAAPLLDIIELKAATAATRDGALDVAKLVAIPSSRLDEMVAQVREHNADAQLALFVLCGTTDDPRAKGVADMAPDDSLYGPFFGEPGQVLDAVAALEDRGITRVTISPFNLSAFEAIAEARR